MRLTVKDQAGTVVFDAAGDAVRVLLGNQRPVLIVADDTGQAPTTPVVCLLSAAMLRDVAFAYAEQARGLADRFNRPLTDRERNTIAAFRRAVGG